MTVLVEVAVEVAVFSTITNPVFVVVAGVVEAFPPKSEVIETVADASEETTFGTILTIPMLKKTKSKIIAPIIRILKKVLVGEVLFVSIMITLYNIATVCQLTPKPLLMYNFRTYDNKNI